MEISKGRLIMLFVTIAFGVVLSSYLASLVPIPHRVVEEVTETAAVVEEVTETAVLNEKPMFFKIEISSIISAVTGEKQTEPSYFVCEIDPEKFINERVIDCIPEEDGS